MDACVTMFVLWVAACGVAALVKDWEKSAAEARAAKAAAEAKAADEQFLREHPAAWLAKERAGLEREHLQAGKKYADEKSQRENVGTLAAVGRTLGWW